MSAYSPEPEGVIKFDLAFASRPLQGFEIAPLRAWRRILKQLGMLGQHPDRYNGLGFGNLSMRTVNGFLISGSQTGDQEDPGLTAYAEVTRWQLADNRVEAHGLVSPSSESLTHAAVYELSSDIAFVFHVHCAAIWRAAASMGLPATAGDIGYGTPAMAGEVRRLVSGSHGMFVMGGHEDGVVAFAETAERAGSDLIACYAGALQYSSTP